VRERDIGRACVCVRVCEPEDVWMRGCVGGCATASEKVQKHESVGSVFHFFIHARKLSFVIL
jgi:hypothetical protein